MAQSLDDALVALHNAAWTAAKLATKSFDPRATRLRELSGETGDIVDGFERPAPVFRSIRKPAPLPSDPHKAMGEILRRVRSA